MKSESLRPLGAAAIALFAAQAEAATITLSQKFENNFAAFSTAVAGATLVTVDFDALPLGGVASGTVVQGNGAGFSVTLGDFEEVVAFGGSNALVIGGLLGATGPVSFSAPVIGVGATFNDVPVGAFGGSFRGEGFDLTGNGRADDADDVAFSSAFAGPTFLGFTATAPFDAVGITSLPPFAAATSIDNLVFAVARRVPPAGVVPAPAALPLVLTAFGGLALFRRFGARKAA